MTPSGVKPATFHTEKQQITKYFIEYWVERGGNCVPSTPKTPPQSKKEFERGSLYDA
jgi:hypothetical protein